MIAKKDPSLRPFVVWGDVLAHIAAGHTTYYVGPMDYYAHKVDARVIGERVHVIPEWDQDFDAFSCDWSQIDRFLWRV